MKFLNISSKYFLVGYLIRVLGENGYGTLTWVDSIVQYFIMIINFGFDLYAAKYVVENKENPTKLHHIISTIYYIKGALFCLCFLFLIPLSFNSQINDVLKLIFLMMLMGFGEVLTPIWFFQGIEKMKIITYITFFSKLTLILLTYFYVKSNTDITLYILFLVVTNIIWGFSGFLMMKKEADFKFMRVYKTDIKNCLKEGYLFFVGKFSTFLFNLGTLFLIGYVFSKGQVAGFDIAIKIIFVFIIPFEVLQQAIFPMVVRGLEKSILQIITIITLLVSVLISVILFLFSDKVITIFGGMQMLKYTYILNSVLILIPIVSLTIIIGNCFMIAKGLYKEYNWSLFIPAITFVFAVVILFVSHELTFLNIIITRILIEIQSLAIRIYYVLKKKLIFI